MGYVDCKPTVGAFFGEDTGPTLWQLPTAIERLRLEDAGN